MCPNIVFALHQCTRYIFKPAAKHEAALKCIGHNLKGALDTGLILPPINKIKIDFFLMWTLRVYMDKKTSRILTAPTAELAL
ncbi:hypothetical protein ACHAW6_003538 [Cyclotella cf. meneghiniana]